MLLIIFLFIFAIMPTGWYIAFIGWLSYFLILGQGKYGSSFYFFSIFTQVIILV